MTKDEALKMALEALVNNRYIIESEVNPPEALEEFDVAIAALRQVLEQPDAIEAAVLAEREACANVCESLRDEDGYEAWGVECAAAIRARMK